MGHSLEIGVIEIYILKRIKFYIFRVIMKSFKLIQIGFELIFYSRLVLLGPNTFLMVFIRGW